MVVNQQELARCLGLTARQVRNLRKDYGMFPNDDTKKYALEECIQEYIRFKIEEETGRRSNLSKEKVSAEHEEVKKQISLLKLKKLKAELHLAKDVERYLTGLRLAFKAKREGLPTKMAMQVAGMTAVNEIINTLSKSVREALNELSEYDPQEIDGKVSIVEDIEEEEGEDEEELTEEE